MRRLGPFVVKTARVRRVACMYEDDDFGVSGLTALEAALANVGVRPVPQLWEPWNGKEFRNAQKYTRTSPYRIA